MHTEPQPSCGWERSASLSKAPTIFAASEMALTPHSGVAPWAEQPVIPISMTYRPLAPSLTISSVSSGMMHNPFFIRSCFCSFWSFLINLYEPLLLPSSSTTAQKMRLQPSATPFLKTSSAMAQPAFMSHAPRPYNLFPSFFGTNGSVSHPCITSTVSI